MCFNTAFTVCCQIAEIYDEYIDKKFLGDCPKCGIALLKLGMIETL